LASAHSRGKEDRRLFCAPTIVNSRRREHAVRINDKRIFFEEGAVKWSFGSEELDIF
jgi:hypothetical protein